MANSPKAGLKKLRDALRSILDERQLLLDAGESRARWRYFLHFWIMVARSFGHNRCPVRAAALAYTTILSLIPILAVMVIVSTALLQQEGGKRVDQMIDTMVQTVAPHLDLVQKSEEEETQGMGKDTVAANIKAFIANIESGKLGTVAVGVLILVAISLLVTVEKTFNDIWGVSQGRGIIARTVRYWTAITLGPLCAIAAFALTTGSHLDASREWLLRLPVLGELFFRLIPFVIVSLAFGLLYWLVPNIRVSWKAALVGGLVGGTLWQLNNLMSVFYVSRVVTYSRIYGSLSIIPIFLIGIYLSWLILLFGAQVAYGFQNRKAYLQQLKSEDINQKGLEYAALCVMTILGERFNGNEPPVPAQYIADRMKVSSRLIGGVMAKLIAGGLVVEASADEAGFVPARPLEHITGRQILDAMRSGEGRDLKEEGRSGQLPVRSQYERIEQAEAAVSGTLTLAELVRESAAEPASSEASERET